MNCIGRGVMMLRPLHKQPQTARNGKLENFQAFLPVMALLLLPALPMRAQGTSRASFENTAQAILNANCLLCNNQGNRTSGLAFDSRDDILKGGKRGPAVKPGSPDESRLIQAV